MNQIVIEREIPVFGAAVISSLAIYCPIPILRGALFGLFPGISNRSWRMGIKGAFFGALFEVAYFVVWAGLLSIMLNFVWEPRRGYNVFLARWLPGSTLVVTHSGTPWPNVVQFHVNIMLWLTAMVFGWWFVWRPRLPVGRLVTILVTANVSGLVACSILWVVSPKDHWWCHVAEPFIDLEGIPWIVVFLAVFPICGVLTALWFKKDAEQTPGGDVLKAAPEESR